ncbi:hypothetical protein fugu_016615 [Takifugu bimaculatus]|uniref:DPF1-3 N-terminal domain-containing protein n=1 Tax=Takifugu bimaculatus TaxID=433685 RepID=A0A4Z2BU98_9TELE|nr:hypothetical protein fugu_016615 [Takifugu bimaculatus]
MAAAIQNPLKALGDQFYKDAIEQCRSYNARVTAGQMYTYPARCWRKKRRLENSTDARLGIYGLHLGGSLMTKDSLPSQSTTLEALLRGEGLDRRNNSKNDEESLLEIQRVLEADAAEDAFDDDDYEVDTPKRRHRGKGRGRGSGRRRADADDDKPYICDIYAKRYRNRTGLSYHYTHSHLAEEERARGRGSVVSRSPSAQQTDRHKRPKGPGGMSIPNNYCSKCHGANKKMAKSGLPYSGCQCTTDGGEEKEDGAFAGAEELFGTTSESDTSTFHGFEDDELEEPAANGNGIPNRHR